MVDSSMANFETVTVTTDITHSLRSKYF